MLRNLSYKSIQNINFCEKFMCNFNVLDRIQVITVC